jgi:hypothetical protein
MMSTIWLRRYVDGLFPYDTSGELELDQYPQGKPLKAKIIVPRNGDTNRLYHAIVTRVAHGMGIGTEALDRDIKRRAGFVTEYHTEKCGIVQIPRSTSFTDCEDEIEFLQFFDRALVIIHGELGIPHSATADLLNKKERKLRV